MNDDLQALTNYIRQLPGAPTARMISFRSDTEPEKWDYKNDDCDLEEIADRLGNPTAYLIIENIEADLGRLRIFRILPSTAMSGCEVRQLSWLAVASWLPRLVVNSLVAKGLEPAGPSPNYARLLLPPPFLC